MVGPRAGPRSRVALQGGPLRDDENLRQLRRHLVGPEQDRLRRLEQRLDDPGEQLDLFAEVLPRAVHRRAERDDELAWSLRPIIKSSIHQEVRSEPEVFAEAIFPAIGPAIGKSIRAAIADMVQRLNEVLSNALSIERVRWRIEAARAGRPYAEVVLLRTLVYRVEQVFLVHRESGVLLQHAVGAGVEYQDPALVSGMLTAIGEFAREAFAEREGLDSFQVGPLSVCIEAGARAYVAAVVRGKTPSDLGDSLRTTLHKVMIEVGDALDDFHGDLRPFERTQPIVEECLRSERRTPSRRRGRVIAAAAAAAVLLAVLGWGTAAARARHRFHSAVQALRDEPGVVVEDARFEHGRYLVSGLRDPLARTPAEVLADRRLDPGRLHARLQPFQSLDPGIVQERVRRLLSPPGSVTLAFAPGQVTASGHARQDWIQNARQRMAALATVTAFSDKGVVDDDAAADARALGSRIEQVVVRFPPHAVSPPASQRRALAAQITRLQHLFQLAPRAGLVPRVAMVGAEQRAQGVRTYLVASGLPPGSLVTRTIAGPDRRRVTFRVEWPHAPPGARP
jgi:OOP family OmpA-OmpF porin